MRITCHHTLEIQEIVVHFPSSTVIGSSLTRSTLGHYTEHNFFYPNDSAAFREEKTFEELLSWLNYPGMDQRHEEVEKAHKNTFRWIFDGYRTDAGDTTESWNLVTPNPTRPQNTGFVTWLREENGIFWINGKPGAGKSTLMKCIMEDPRLEEYANFWAGSLELSVSSFYFWKLGSPIQKSLCGLYRALLWQILKDDTTSTRIAFPKWQMSFRTAEPRLEALRTALNRLIKKCVLRKKFLILIDGLDEYEDNASDMLVSQERLSQDIMQIVENGSVKVIIASRPHRVFKSYFSHRRKLAIHELTAGDLERFAHDRFLNDATIRPSGEDLSATECARLRRLVMEIVRRSCGVFLWARIVIDLARVRIRDYHDLDQLEGILAKLHPDIEELFEQIMQMILNLNGPEKIEGLRYLALTSCWFTTLDNRSWDANWLPISILSIGSELHNPEIAESWLQDNTKRLTAIGHNELRAEGRVESFCFGLLETSTINEGARGPPEPNPIRKVIRPLHRTLMEYLSRHSALQIAQNLSVPGYESFDTYTAILLGLVVMEHHIYPLLSEFRFRDHADLTPTPGLIDKVLIFNKAAERSTGRAQIALLSAFDRIMEAGFAGLMGRDCHVDHDHGVRCVSPDHALLFHTLVNRFAYNPHHPLIPRKGCTEGFLDLIAITMTCDANTLLKDWISTKFPDGAQPRAISSARAARLLDFALNKRYIPSFGGFEGNPNLDALRSLLQIGACPETRFHGVSAWERHLDHMLLQAVVHARNNVDEKVHDSRWDLEALHVLCSHGVRQDVYRTTAVVLEEPGQPSISPCRPKPGKGQVIEFRCYSFVQIIRQIASLWQHEHTVAQISCRPAETFILGYHEDPKVHASEIAELEKIRHHLDNQNINSISRSRCSWSDLEGAGKNYFDPNLGLRHETGTNFTNALTTARLTGCDITRYQQIRTEGPPPDGEGVMTEWLPHGCREAQELLENLAPDAAQQWMDRLTQQAGEQSAGFDVVGWLAFDEEKKFYYNEYSSSSESSSDNEPAQPISSSP